MNLMPSKNTLIKHIKVENSFFLPDDVYLLKLLKDSKSSDPSMHSLAYLRMTSRKGLSCFHGEHSDVLFSLHPNDDQRYIIYPPNEKSGYFDVAALSKILKKSGKGVQVIRVPENFLPYVTSVVMGEASLNIDLDYKYPVHIIDTFELKNMIGNQYRRFRNKVSAVSKEKIKLREISFSKKDIEEMKSVTSKWALELFGESHDQDTNYIDHFLSKLVSRTSVKGLISEKNGITNGFTIWEEPENNYDTANALVHVSLHQRGIFELLHHSMAISLANSGIKKLSLEGAETQGLDAFKRKMNPIQSINLKTIDC